MFLNLGFSNEWRNANCGLDFSEKTNAHGFYEKSRPAGLYEEFVLPHDMEIKKETIEI